jgi:hypothetical protein
MDTRTTVCLAVLVVLATVPLSAQKVPSRQQTPRGVDPVELSGPPKKPIVVTPAKRAFVQSSVMTQLNSNDRSVLTSALREITSFIQQDPTDTDFYLLRATVSCQIAGENKEAMLNDVNTSIKLWNPNENSAFDSLNNHYALKAKIDFLLGRYADALNDLDAGMGWKRNSGMRFGQSIFSFPLLAAIKNARNNCFCRPGFRTCVVLNLQELGFWHLIGFLPTLSELET